MEILLPVLLGILALLFLESVAKFAFRLFLAGLKLVLGAAAFLLGAWVALALLRLWLP